MIESALVALFCILLSGFARAGDELPRREIVIHSATGTQYRFDVDVASTPREREKGLMYRKEMPENCGMLFVFPAPRSVTMWMRNTYIALDMLFIGADHRVVHVKKNAKPMDDELISSGGDVTHVLEINAGLAERFSISAGDFVSGNALEIMSDQ